MKNLLQIVGDFDIVMIGEHYSVAWFRVEYKGKCIYASQNENTSVAYAKALKELKFLHPETKEKLEYTSMVTGANLYEMLNIALTKGLKQIKQNLFVITNPQ